MSNTIKSLPGHVRLFTDIRKGRNLFIETGTFKGNGVISALESGFKKVLSFEIDENLSRNAIHFFQNDKRVEIYNSSSCSIIFANIVQKIQEDSVFWLDAHFNGSGPNPLIAEILFIGCSPLSHGILIDDVRLFKNYGVSKDLICHVLSSTLKRKIKTSYKTVREKFQNDVLYIEIE